MTAKEIHTVLGKAKENFLEELMLCKKVKNVFKNNEKLNVLIRRVLEM